MIKPGNKVKILDVGTLATCLAIKGNSIELELDGETFWIAKKFCEAIGG